MKRVGILILSVLSIMVFFCSCSSMLYLNDESSENQDQINAVPDNNKLQEMNSTLYFASKSENYLIPELRQISYSANEPQTYAILEELIKGPADDGLLQLISLNTKILSVTTNNEYVYLSLSKDFLDVPAATEGWEYDQRMVDLVYTQRRMAVYSIVNTLTEISGYAYVQILIDIDSDGTAEKISRGEAGFWGDGNETAKLDILSRDHDYILTPANTVRLAFELINKNQPERLYDILAPTTEYNSISYNEFYDMFISSNVVLGNYSVDPEVSVSNYGNSFIATVNYSAKNAANSAVLYSKVPVNVYRSGNLYLIDLNFIKKVLKG